MKISKVNNLKTAVSVREEGKTGIMYRDPERPGRSVQVNLEKQVEGQIASAKRLYKIFNISKETKKTDADLMAEAINRSFIVSKAAVPSYTAAQLCEDFHSALSAYHGVANEKVVNDLVHMNLRRTLFQSSYHGAELAVLVGIEKKQWSTLTDSEKEEVCLFLDRLRADYQCLKIKKHVITSIEHQNMLIQPGESGVLIPAKIENASHRNMQEKDALTRFLQEYAVLDNNVRQDLRRRLRRIVDLYFYGEEAVIQGDFDEWEDHAHHRKDQSPFSKAAADLAETSKESNEKKAAQKAIKEIRQILRAENIDRYRKSMETIEQRKELFFEDILIGKYWVHHIENGIERIYTNMRSLEDFRLTRGYLGEKIWKDILNYICTKYLAVGKAVYHYAISEDLGDQNKDLQLGELIESKRGGLSSFDYEQIKAEEMLQRNIAVYVAFAANHLAGETVKRENNKEDFLVLGKRDLDAMKKPKTLRNILQFFGGASSWSSFDFHSWFNESYTELDFLRDLQRIVFALRNESFHFDTKNINPGTWNQKLISSMFAYECNKCSKLQKDKFYSNNLPMFYRESDLRDMLNLLYRTQSERASQVPSFNKVIVRRNFTDFLKNELHWQIHFSGDNSLEKQQKCESALYYLMKEIYYCLFLQGKGRDGEHDVLKKFLQWCRRNHEDQNDAKKKLAFRNFQKRINDLTENGQAFSFSELCQTIMTDYNLYNGNNRKVKNSYDHEKKKDSYAHYKMLLLKGIREVFAAYMNDEFGAFGKPEYREKPAEEEFLADYKTPIYEQLMKDVEGDIELQKWYILGRLLNPKQANLLAGVVRHYIQYSRDISRRAKETRHVSEPAIAIKRLRGYVNVLDICIKLSGTTTNRIEDYFDDNDDYARHIGNYLDYEGQIPDISLSAQLESFCEQYASEEDDELKNIGIFYDAVNPIINRNILFAKLYGTEDVLRYSLAESRVKQSDISAYYRQQKKIAKYKNTGRCKTEEEQKELKAYQEIKNKIEFRNIVEYEEIIDELQSQLIDWCYLRERDLMYYQLGFHYLCLKGKSERPEGYSLLRCGKRCIHGAILYQIVSMYTNGLPVYIYQDGEVVESDPFLSTGEKIGKFCNYTSGSISELSDKKWRSDQYYLAGLELFENVSEHDRVIDLRNYIEHFHYYTRLNRSILDLYGEVFDRFFSYDMKYQKNVINILYNILMRHFIKSEYAFGTTEKEMDNKKNKERASISLKEKRGLSSDKMTYKLDDGQGTKTELMARNKDFLMDVARILYYPEKPEDVIKEEAAPRKNSTAGQHSSASNRNNNMNRKRRDDKEYQNWKRKNNRSGGSFGSSLGDLLGNIKI